MIESHVLERNCNRYHFDKMHSFDKHEQAGVFEASANMGLKDIGNS